MIFIFIFIFSVRVYISSFGTSNYYLDGNFDRKILNKCLGAADFDSSNNIDLQNWDYGTKFTPHFIRLVRTVNDYRDGGFYVVIYFDPYTSIVGEFGTIIDGQYDFHVKL
jgi:hypothetical protein